MNLKKLIVASLLLITASATTMAQEMPSIPTDPDVKVGKFKEGIHNDHYRSEDACKTVIHRIKYDVA